MQKSLIKLYYEILPLVDNHGRITGKVARPTIDILLKYKHGKMIGPIKAVIDSGSDYNLFPAEIADVLGIKITNGRLKVTEGIGGKTIKTYRHYGIKMFVEGQSFETSIDFSKEISVPLLGQQGFFDKFKQIAFKRPIEKIIISI